MNTVKSNLLTVLKQLKELQYTFYAPESKTFLHKNVPYYSQWESKELADDFLSGERKAEDDPKWKQSGAKDKMEYANWSWSACGITCFQMIYAHKTGKKIPLVELGKKALNFGAYTLNKEAYEKGEHMRAFSNLLYEPLVKFIGKEYGIEGKVKQLLVLPEIIAELDQNNFVIASVGGSIRDPKTTNIFRGGHLVLMLGYDLEKKIFWMHNPSGFYNQSQEYAQISFSDLEKFFDYKGVVIYNSSTRQE